jgi:hypothetical protein
MILSRQNISGSINAKLCQLALQFKALCSKIFSISGTFLRAFSTHPLSRNGWTSKGHFRLSASLVAGRGVYVAIFVNTNGVIEIRGAFGGNMNGQFSRPRADGIIFVGSWSVFVHGSGCEVAYFFLIQNEPGFDRMPHKDGSCGPRLRNLHLSQG